MLHWWYSWGQQAVAGALLKSVAAYIAARIEWEVAVLSWWVVVLWACCRLVEFVCGHLEEIAAAWRAAKKDPMSLVGPASVFPIGNSAVASAADLKARFVLVLNATSEVLDEYLPLIQLGGPGGWWIAFTTSEEYPHDFVYVALRLVPASLASGGFRVVVGRGPSRRPPPGIDLEVNWICSPPAYDKWAPSDAEVDALCSEAVFFAAALSQGGGLRATGPRKVELRGGASAMPLAPPTGGHATGDPAAAASIAAPGTALGAPEAAAGLAIGFGAPPDSSATANDALLQEVLQLRTMFDSLKVEKERKAQKHKKKEKAGAVPRGIAPGGVGGVGRGAARRPGARAPGVRAAGPHPTTIGKNRIPGTSSGSPPTGARSASGSR